jgi:hypothetical protein
MTGLVPSKRNTSLSLRLPDLIWRFGAITRAHDAGIAQALPRSHGKVSQDAVAEDRRIAFAAAREGDDALRENGSFFVLVFGEAELAADLIEGD